MTEMLSIICLGLVVWLLGCEDELPICECGETLCSSREICTCDGVRCRRSILDAPATTTNPKGPPCPPGLPAFAGCRMVR